MTRHWQRRRTRWLATVMAVWAAIAAAGPGVVVAGPLSTAEPVFGAATGTLESDGEMLPTGSGRFTVDDRIYAGRSLGRSVGALAATCFTGDLRSVETWSLEAPRMLGLHQSEVTIRSERGVLTLRLRGQMEQFTASGTWSVVRATGGCAPLDGDGRYTATYAPAASRSDLRLTFDGDAQS